MKSSNSMTLENNLIVKFLSKNIFIISALVIAIIFSNWHCPSEYKHLEQNFFFYPYISIWFSEIIESSFGISGLIFASQILIPSSIFYLIALIFSRYLNKLWSLTIAFVSVISFANHPFRDFLIGLAKLELSGSSLLPEITNFPLPSLPVLLFLISFYYSTQPVELNKKRITFFTIIWSSQIFVSAIDAMFGVSLWFSYFSLKIIRRRKVYGLKNIFNLIALQVAIFAAFFIPALLLADFSAESINISENFNIFTYCTLYYTLPIVLTAILFKVHKIDPHEILYKFWSVYVLMGIEFALVSASFFFSKGVSLEILTSRTPLFFLHFYYYLPVIFYASKEYFAFYRRGDGNGAANMARKIIHITFNRLSYIYLPIIIALNIWFAIISSMHFNAIH
jgi:hypothetical protein